MRSVEYGLAVQDGSTTHDARVTLHEVLRTAGRQAIEWSQDRVEFSESEQGHAHLRILLCSPEVDERESVVGCVHAWINFSVHSQT